MISKWRVQRYFADLYKSVVGVPVPDYVFDSGCLFIHIPKAAGVSISTSLYGREIGHNRLGYYRDLPKDLYVFSVVRNPFERVVSAWRFLSRGGMSHHPNGSKFNKAVLSRYRGFDDFVCNWLSAGNEYSFLHFIPQVEFLRTENGSLSRVNTLLRFESLQSDFKKIQERFQLQKPLEIMNSTGMVDYRSFYTSRSIDFVRSIYGIDFSLLGYDDSVF